MRLIALDTETTGLDPDNGDRIIEIAAVEISSDPQPRTFHHYLNPDGRQISEGAMAVHGIRNEDLLDKPLFRDIADELSRFIEGSKLVIHNADFDRRFLEAEYRIAGLKPPRVDIIDTMLISQMEFPLGRHNLNALCRRFNISTDHRERHGALTDTILLAEVYKRWKGQGNLFDAASPTQGADIRRSPSHARATEAAGKMISPNPEGSLTPAAGTSDAHQPQSNPDKETAERTAWPDFREFMARRKNMSR